MASLIATIFVYNGPGVVSRCLQQTMMMLHAFFPSSYNIEMITPQEVKRGHWMEEAALFVMPGGQDVPYVKSLGEEGAENISSYVLEGGAFLGICAGSYFAGKYVEFALGTPLEVTGDRLLRFFPGTVRGPNLAPYSYKSQSGARAAKLRWKEGDECFFYYNGGGYFVDAESHQNVEILATYDEDFDRAAIISCEVGKGRAVLTGVHIEYDPEWMEQKRFSPDLTDKMIETKHLREEIVYQLLARLGAPLRVTSL